jgi:hypothetical protein
MADDEELTAEEKAGAERWTAVALCLGYNELAKQAENLGEKVYFRLLRDAAQERFIELGGKTILSPEDPALTLEVGKGMPCVRFRPQDIELMRATVAAHDALAARSGDKETSRG